MAKSTQTSSPAFNRDPFKEGADGYSQFSNWDGYTEYQPGTTQSPDRGKLKPFPNYGKTTPLTSQSDDAETANATPDYGSGLVSSTGADGGAPSWQSHPGKEESFTIVSQRFKQKLTSEEGTSENVKGDI